MTAKPEVVVLSLLVEGSDPAWDLRTMIVGTQETLERQFDLRRLPFGALLLRGKQARRFLKKSMREEVRYRREKTARDKMSGKN